MDSCGAEKIREEHQSLFPPAPTQRGSVLLFFAPQHHSSGPASLKTVENQMLKFTLHEEVRAGPEAPDVLQDTHDLSFWDLLEVIIGPGCRILTCSCGRTRAGNRTGLPK
ncbi:hypothetical protein ILYODFUR_033168 [Ilyodon furcidens]|uniref:Uncharacterized protein n=1 Tax=Ilyodon furcidens TaxID=33524 RepID=A0ABV0TDB9_9TELE